MYNSLADLKGSSLFVIMEKEDFFLKDSLDFNYGKLNRRGIFSSYAFCEIKNEIWTFHETGFLKKHILLMNGSGEKAGLYKTAAMQLTGTLELETMKLNFLSAGFWSSTYHWVHPITGILMTFDSRFFSRRQFKIEIVNLLNCDPLVPLLAFLGIHILISFRSDVLTKGTRFYDNK